MFKTFNKKTRRLFILSLVAILPLSGLWNIGQAAYIHSKAQLAQVLLETAWAKTIHGNKEVKPWPWADTWPVGRLKVPSLGIHRIVLAGANGSSLAFGPGHFFNSAFPGDVGNCLIAGHRDTHFSFLRQLKIGNQLHLQNRQNEMTIYEIKKIMIVHENDSSPLQQSDAKTLTLITCYPFKAMITGGPLRYVIVAKAIPESHSI